MNWTRIATAVVVTSILLIVTVAQAVPAASAVLVVKRRTTQTGPSQPDYTIFIDSADGNKIKAKSATGNVEYIGTDPAAVLQNAITVLANTGGSILLASGTYVWQSVPAFPRNLPHWLKIVGQPGVTIRLTATGPRAFDFKKIADYDSFQNIWIESLVIDCNNVGGQNHVVLGTYRNGIWGESRINIQNITIRNIITENVPVDPTATTERMNIMLIVGYTSPQMQTKITGILIENCDFRGGNTGIDIGTTSKDKGNTVFIDDIHIHNVRHSLLAAQNSLFASANFQIGGSGFGGYVEITDSYGEYSGDVGVEIDALNALVQNVTIKDAVAFMFYQTNYNNPQSGSNQLVTFKDCVALKERLSSNFGGRGWGISTSGGIALGTSVLDNCRFHSSAAPSFAAGEAVYASDSSGIGLTGITLGNFESDIEGIDYSAAADHMINPVALNLGSSAAVTLKNVGLVVHGSSRPTAGRLSVVGIQLVGNMVVNLDNISVDYSVAGASRMVGVDVGNGPTNLSGIISRFVVQQMVGSTSLYGILIRGTETLTISGQLAIQYCDFAVMGGGTSIYFETPSNGANVQVSNNTP